MHPVMLSLAILNGFMIRIKILSELPIISSCGWEGDKREKCVIATVKQETVAASSKVWKGEIEKNLRDNGKKNQLRYLKNYLEILYNNVNITLTLGITTVPKRENLRSLVKEELNRIHADVLS